MREEWAFSEKLADDKITVPIDMCGVGEGFGDIEQMKAKPSVKGTAEAFIEAADDFDASKKDLTATTQDVEARR